MSHSFSSRKALLIWKYKDLIKIVWRHKVQKMKQQMFVDKRESNYLSVSFNYLHQIDSNKCYQVRFWLLLTHLIVFPISTNKTIQKKWNFTKFIRKCLCLSLIFNEVARLRPVNFSKKDTLAQVFSCEFCEISKNTFSVEHLWVTASNHTTLNQQ